MPLRRWLVTPGGIVGLVTIGVAAWVATLLVNRVDGLAAPPYDLAFFNQVVWNVGHGGSWTSSFHEGSFLGLHFSPMLVIPAAINRVAGPDVRVLNLLHALAMAALVPASFLFLRALFRPSRFGPALAAVLAIGLPLWGTTQQVIRSDFHPETAGICLALLAGWAGLTGRHRTMWVLALLALATREDVAYAVIVVGLAVAARGRGRSRRHGRVLVIVATVWLIAVFALLMPALRAGVQADTDRYYAWLGGGLSVLLAPFAQTDVLMFRLSRATPWLAAAGMIVAMLGLPLVHPRWLLLALAPMVAALLSSNRFQANLQLQYGLILVVPLIVAAGFGGRRVLAIAGRRRHFRRQRGSDQRRYRAWIVAPVLGVLLLAPAAAGALAQGAVPPFSRHDPAFSPRPAGLERLRAAAIVVPGDALLTADEGLVAPLAGRARIRRLTAGPVPPADSYVVMERGAWSPTARAGRQHDELLASLVAGERPVLADDGRFVVWGPQPGGPVR
jgi:uncharacterized membrane protein